MSNEIRDKAFKDYCNGMKYKDIAEKYGVSLSAVKSWATRYWKVATKDRKLQPQPKKVATTKPEKKLKEKLLESVGENDELTEKRRLFCLYYAMSHNALQSYLKAYKCTKETAMTNGFVKSCGTRLISACRICYSTASGSSARTSVIT